MPQTSSEKFEATLRDYIVRTHPNSDVVQPAIARPLAEDDELIVPQLQWTFDVMWQVDRVNKHSPKDGKSFQLPQLGEQYVMICARQICDENDQLDVFEFPADSILLSAVDQVRRLGVRIITGRWINMPGQPLAVVMQLDSAGWAYERYKSELLKDHNIRVPEDERSKEVLLYGYMTAQFLADFRHQLDCSRIQLYRQSNMLANFHEWLSVVGLIFLQDWKVATATAYRAHDPMHKPASAQSAEENEDSTPRVELPLMKTMTTEPRKNELNSYKLHKTQHFMDLSVDDPQPFEPSKSTEKKWQPKYLVKKKAKTFEEGKTLAQKPVQKTPIIVPSAETVKSTVTLFEKDAVQVKMRQSVDDQVDFLDWRPRNIVKEAASNIENGHKSFCIEEVKWPSLNADSESKSQLDQPELESVKTSGPEVESTRGPTKKSAETAKTAATVEAVLAKTAKTAATGEAESEPTKMTTSTNDEEILIQLLGNLNISPKQGPVKKSTEEDKEEKLVQETKSPGRKSAKTPKSKRKKNPGGRWSVTPMKY